MKPQELQARDNESLTEPRPKLDVRLATIAKVGLAAYAQRGPGELERTKGYRRSGPLAFVRGNDSGPRNALEGGGYEFADNIVVQVFLTVVPKEGVFDRLQAAADNAPRSTPYRAPLVLRSRAKTVATADVELDYLRELEKDDDVVSVEWTGAVRPTSGVEGEGKVFPPRKAIGLDGAPPDLDGRGVLIGIVDVEGMDLYHPAFIDPYARTRVRALWDQRARRPKEAVTEAGNLGIPPYGRVYDYATLDREIAPAQAEPGFVVPHRALKLSHGTATAGLAAGLGWDNPDAMGIAPGAEIVFVNTYGSGSGALGSMTELSDALAFVFSVADRDDKPCVVNISMGDDLGPRDGSSPVERFIEDMVAAKPGRAVVVAAGNSAGGHKHARAGLSAGETASLEIEVGAGNWRHAAIEIWYRATTEEGAALEISIEAPDDEGPTEPTPSDGAPRAFDSEDTRALVVASRPRDNGQSGLGRVEIFPAFEDGTLLEGTWKVHVRAAGGACEVHAWIDHPYVHFATKDGEEEAPTLTTPGTTRGAITVGAYSLRRKDVYWFSGRGPGRDGGQKPDLVAPGGPLLVAAASGAKRYVDASGTSVAAPLVTGAIALAYQKFGRDLSREALLDKLVPAGKGTYDPAMGRGLLNLSRWFEQASAPPPAPGETVEPDGTAEGARLIHFEGGGGTAHGRKDAEQIMWGLYVLHQGNVPVGHVLVTTSRTEGGTVEHWLLNARYRAPSRAVPRIGLLLTRLCDPIPLDLYLGRFGAEAAYIRADCVPRAAPAPTTISVTDTKKTEPRTKKPKTSREKTMTVAHRNSPRPTDAVQIMWGEYTLSQQGMNVGKLLVEEINGPQHTKEHWVLYSTYRWPSKDYQTQEIQFHYVREPGDLQDFLNGLPSGATYVLADCNMVSTAP